MNDLVIMFYKTLRCITDSISHMQTIEKKKKNHEIRTIILGPPIIDQQQLGLKSKCLGEITKLTID